MKLEEAQAHLAIRRLSETPVVNTVSFLHATLLKPGARSVQRPITVVFSPVRALEKIRPGHDFVNMLGVIFPVGSNIERATSDQTIRNQVNKRRLHNPSLAVTFLRPRVWKVQVHPRQRLPGNLMLKHFDSIVDDQPQIVQIRVSGLQETAAHAGFMNVNTQKIHAWIPAGLFDERIAIAKTDFQSRRMQGFENLVEIQRLGMEFQAEIRHQLDQRPLLRRREPSVPSHKAPDCAATTVILADLHGL